ncbi:hypothetical protein [Frankia sp. Cppng1_Ct_nod]|uniref:hypothetical protein n=1 Tax=Frankia sp. Cppng1_Ct_nod TaxID=2897162 RepID=UPI0013EF5FBB|nr:hypothetical protein [Frankia sp. Cppng1_Ct_nod]
MTTNTGPLRTLEPLFHRAPNAHNTQPWHLRYASGVVEVGWQERYELGPSDPVHRDLRLSLGAFVESCLVVCGDMGVAVRFVADYNPGSRRIGRLMDTSEPNRTRFTAADVAARRAWRGRWTPEPIPDDLLDELTAITAVRGGRLVALDCAPLRPLLTEASRWFVADPGILAELRKWSRLNPRHPDYHRDGLSDVALALKWYETVGMRAALRRKRSRPHHFGLRAALANGQAKAFDGDGSVLVLLGPVDTDEAGEVRFGRLVQRLWLLLARHGFAAHPQSHLIDCPATAGAVAELTAAVDERPLWIARVGRPDPHRANRVPLSARRLDPHGEHGNGNGNGNSQRKAKKNDLATTIGNDSRTGKRQDRTGGQRGRHRDRRSHRERRRAT